MYRNIIQIDGKKRKEKKMEKIVSIGDKSKEMGVSRQTIYNMLKARRLKADYIDMQGRHFWKVLRKENENELYR